MVFEYQALVEGLGYTGVLLVSFLGSVVPFLPAPYLVPVVFAVVRLGLSPPLVALLAALGASLGKLVIFTGSRAGRRVLSEETRARMEPLQRLLMKHGWVAVLLAAATPLPDDVIYIPLAIGGLGLAKFFVWLLAGKMLMTALVVYATINLEGPLEAFLPRSFTGFLIFLSIAYLLLAILVSYVFIRVDWGRLLGPQPRNN